MSKVTKDDVSASIKKTELQNINESYSKRVEKTTKLYEDNFIGMLGERRASGFMIALRDIANTPALINCDIPSLMRCALACAYVDLSLSPALGEASIVPYKVRQGDKYVTKAQFQIMKKGYIQLAQRSGNLKYLSSGKYRRGELVFDKLRGIINGMIDVPKTEPFEGYFAHIETKSGFIKSVYMTNEEVMKHALKYSSNFKAFKSGRVSSSLWNSDFDAMAEKTVLRQLLSHYAEKSTESQLTSAFKYDMSTPKTDVINVDSVDDVVYPDNNVEEIDYKTVE